MSFANPAEICRDRGWEDETRIKRPGHSEISVLTIKAIGRDCVLTETQNGQTYVWKPGLDELGMDITEDFATFVEVEQKPVVTIERQGRDIIFDVLIDGVAAYRCHPRGAHGESEFSKLEYVLLKMAEAGKAAIEGKDEAKSEGPYATYAAANGCGGVIIRDADEDNDEPPFSAETSTRTDRLYGTILMNELIDEITKIAATRLNALHAKFKS